MTNSPPAKPAGRNAPKRVRKRLADGTIKVYEYARAPAQPSRFLAASGHAIRGLARDYTKAPEFLGLSESWRAATIYYLGLIEDAIGWMTVADIEDPRARGEFYALRDRFASHPFKADKIVGVLCTLLAWGYERRRIAVNHATGLERLIKGPRRADKTWSEDRLAALLAAAPPDLARMIRLALLTAARLGDLRRLDWSMIRDGWLTFSPAKTAKMIPPPIVRLPIAALPPLGELLDECAGGARWPEAGPILRTQARGIVWSTPNFNAVWRGTVARAGLADADRHFHDLRGTAITRLLEAGCTDAEAASISGHVLGGRSTLRAYAARTDAMALAAFTKLARWLAARPVVIDLTTARQPAGNRG